MVLQGNYGRGLEAAKAGMPVSLNKGLQMHSGETPYRLLKTGKIQAVLSCDGFKYSIGLQQKGIVL